MLQRQSFKIEICANSVESCIAAQRGGADRVELCAGIPEGGTTPSYGTIATARQAIGIKLHVIIRPRGGDFLYSAQELDIMEKDIQVARELGADGVVFGCLLANGHIDIESNKRLCEAARGMSVTLHRAFDSCCDPHEALEELVKLHVDRILTSGQQPTAEKGIPLLHTLQKEAQGRIILLAGCGVNEHNIARIHQETGIYEYHFSAREKRKSGMTYTNRNVYMGKQGEDEYSTEVTTSRRVADTIASLLGQ
jgi:copper homeostasis protein